MFQAQPAVNLHNPSYRKARWHHNNAVCEEHWNTDTELTMRGAETMSAAGKEQGTGHIPMAQPTTCSRTRNKQLVGPQMAIPSHQVQLSLGSQIPLGGELKWWYGHAVIEGRSNVNDKSGKKLMKLSVNQNEKSTMLYSTKTAPKAPDKGAQCVDDRNNTEVHNTPQPAGRDCVEQSLKLHQQDTHVHQWSLCDSCHTSHDTMHKRVAEREEMEYMHLTHPTRQIHGPYWDQDSDSSSSEYEVANKEFSTRHEVSDKLDK